MNIVCYVWRTVLCAELDNFSISVLKYRKCPALDSTCVCLEGGDGREIVNESINVMILFLPVPGLAHFLVKYISRIVSCRSILLSPACRYNLKPLTAAELVKLVDRLVIS